METDDYMAKWILEEVPGRPEDWPTCNLREVKIERVWQAVRIFYKDPNPIHRDIMLREAFCRQRGDLPSVGPKYRISDYEVKLLVNIYLAGACFNSWILKMFVYHVVMEWIDSDRYYERQNKTLPIIDMVRTMSKKFKNKLPPPLILFYEAYYEYCEDWARRRFGVILYNVCKDKVDQNPTNDRLKKLEHEIVCLLYDISGIFGTDRDVQLLLNRDEITKLIELEARILHKRGLSIMRRPLKGTLMIQLSNLILKSRNGESTQRIYKYIKESDLNKAFINKQIWVRDIRDLNDHYEGIVAKEVVDSIICKGPSWVRSCKLEYKKKFFITCYSKKADNKSMNSRYGECVLGYYGDRIVDYIAPIYWRTERMPWARSGKIEAFPVFSQIAILDVIYDREEAMRELEYLIQCIDILGRTNNQKCRFFKEILQYWKLSFKDEINRDEPYENWREEHERRYVIFYYDEFDYRGTLIDKDRKLKFETTAMIAPDFLLGVPEGNLKQKISAIMNQLYKSTTVPDYYVCDNCIGKGVYPDGFIGECIECGSKSIKVCKTSAFHYEYTH